MRASHPAGKRIVEPPQALPFEFPRKGARDRGQGGLGRARDFSMNSLPAFLFTAGIMVLTSGCETYVTSSKAAAFNQSVTQAAAALQASLDEVQAVEVGNSVDSFAAGERRTFEGMDLSPKLSDGESRAIADQFGFLVSYSQALKDATTPGTSWSSCSSTLNSAASKIPTDASALATTVSGSSPMSPTTTSRLSADAGNLAKAVATAGQGVLTLYGEEKAYTIARGADLPVQRYCSDLEELLAGDDAPAPSSGLAGILRADYEKRITVLRNLVTTVPPPHGYDDPGYVQAYLWRSQLAQQYSQETKDAQAGVAKMLALRKAIAKIASAHAALAQRNDEAFQQRLSDEADLLETAFKSAPAPSSGAQK